MHTSSRRDFLTKAGAAVGIGAAVVPLASLLPPQLRLTRAALAQQDAPELTDEDVAAFIESVELVAIDAYASASASGKLSAGAAQAIVAFPGHHREHASAFAALAGSKAGGKPHPKFSDIVTGQLQGAPDEKAVLQILFDLENAAAGTFLYALGAMKGDRALTTSASFLPAEAQHAVAIGLVLGKSVEDIIPAFENQDRGLDPTKFPLNTTTTSTTAPEE